MYFVSDSQKGIPKLKQHRAKLVVGILFCALIAYQVSLSAQSYDNWSFAVSGDSRNCGDIVMPGIAEGVRADKAQFYWHLGDYRATYDFKEIRPANIPAQTVERYGSKQLQACFEESKSTYAPEGPTCAASTAGGN